jgi:hypothetical protein
VFLGVEVLDKDGISPEGSPVEDENRIDGNETEQGVLDSKPSFVLGFPLFRAHCPIWGSSVHKARQRRKHPQSRPGLPVSRCQIQGASVHDVRARKRKCLRVLDLGKRPLSRYPIQRTSMYNIRASKITRDLDVRKRPSSHSHLPLSRSPIHGTLVYEVKVS